MRLLLAYVCFSVITTSWAHLLRRQDATTLPGLFEGDIMGINGGAKPSSSQNLWLNRRIPYKIGEDIAFKSKTAVKKAMKLIESKTCLQFVQATAGDHDHLNFETGAGCASYIGRHGGTQTVVTGPECHEVGDVLHVLMHVLGFFHENARTDRDKHVFINWDNIKDNRKRHFKAYIKPDVNFGLPYDINSVTHMSSYAFAKNDTHQTITPTSTSHIEQRLTLSSLDIDKINIQYCGKRPPPMMRDTVQRVLPGERTGRCRDRLSKCTLWATQGKCRSSRVKRQCAQSCLQCTRRACEDQQDLCYLWALFKECRGQNRYQVIEACPVSCGICQAPGPNRQQGCRDEYRRCRNLANQDRCSNAFFKVHCKRSCNACS